MAVFIRGFDATAEASQIIADARMFEWSDERMRREIRDALERAMDVAYEEGTQS